MSCDHTIPAPPTGILPPASTLPDNNWWYSNQLVNMLRGFYSGVDADGFPIPDSDNPPKLPDHVIIEFLWIHPGARRDFNILFPLMLPEEQERLASLIETHPYLTTGYRQDVKVRSDNFQARQNKMGVRTAGPHAGRGYR